MASPEPHDDDDARPPHLMINSLPIEPLLPDLKRALRGGRAAVLQAPPGSGKTTRVPVALLDEPWLEGRRILLLQPRRLAARAAAERMADVLGEPVGQTVGYRIRLERRVGSATRIEVLTEGLLTRRLLTDPGLEGVGAVLFDEFHERSLHADLGLALCREVQSVLRDDLRLLIMSATLDGETVAGLLGGAPVLSGGGRLHPVDTRYLERDPEGAVEDAVAAAVVRALDEAPAAGDMLAFLPGEAEIRRTERRLLERGLGGGAVRVLPLYGALPKAAQTEALAPAPPGGRRKVVLATSIAETSLTIEGVRAVVDGGLTRRPRFDPRSGMTRLETARVSRASADQRRGRAGRLGPGVCHRLWTEATQRALRPFDPPEIAVADLAPLALDLAAWGVADPAQLAWLDPPPAGSYDRARRLLLDLGALDADGRITPQGRRMVGLGVHPRLAHMLLRAEAMGLGGLACDLAALLDERDLIKAPPGQRDVDLRTRLELLRAPDVARHLPPGVVLDRAAHRRAVDTARDLRRRLGVRGDDGRGGSSAVGPLIALAYPDRLAQRRPGGLGRFRLSNGSGAWLPETGPLAAEDWLAVAELDGEAREARIFLAAPVALEELRGIYRDAVRTESFIRWDERNQAVVARRQERLGALVLSDAPLPNPPREEVTAALLQGVRRLGLACLPWTPELRQLQARVGLLRRLEDGAWPDLSDEALLADLDDWLAPFLDGVTGRADLARVDLDAALCARLGWERRRALDELAPARLEVPSGSRPRLDYASGDDPVLAVKLQEMFGQAETPRIAGGRVPVTLQLLSPAGRPVQVTRDLASFWRHGYAEVRRDLRGRYPKHPWPEDPLSAEPTARTKPRAGR